ncbi:MAG: energy transducer TonB, partial [Bacteroidota bacterium]
MDRQPQPLNYETVKARIGYPMEAIKHKIEGKVHCRLLIDEKGAYVRHHITRTAHPSLEAAVIPELKHLKYSPALKNAKPVSYWVNVLFQFSYRPPVLRHHIRTRKQQVNKPIYRSLRKSKQAFEEGLNFIENGASAEAKLAFDRSIRFNPHKINHSEEVLRLLTLAHLEKGKLLIQAEQWRAAFTNLTEAVGRVTEQRSKGFLAESEIIQLYLLRAKAFLAMEQPLRALDDCNWIIHQYPQAAPMTEIYCQRALTYQQLNKYDAAFIDLERAKLADPAHPLPHFCKAQILIELDGIEAATLFMKQAVNLGLAGRGRHGRPR